MNLIRCHLEGEQLIGRGIGISVRGEEICSRWPSFKGGVLTKN